ncbi:MAG TPA: aminotransferase class V-fold PLP-dependent enzyme [Ktedonobacterales bacterium]
MVSESVDAQEQDKFLAIHTELPATDRIVYLNTGTNGPLPRRSHAALVEYSEREVMEGRIGAEVFSRLSKLTSDTRAAFAALLGCDASEVALTHNTTEGINIALMGIDWRPGDEVITSCAEHPGVLNPVYLLRQRYGVRIRMTDIGMPGHDDVAELRQALSPRTRAVALSHVSWSTGVILPVRELADATHEAGALFICDAAQSCGMIPSQVYALGVDAYACSGQKWLCGPDGTGALFVRKDRLGDIQQSYMGPGSIVHGMSDYEGHFVPPAAASRYQAATIYPGSLAGLRESLRWLSDDLGWEWIYQRVATLGAACRDALSTLDGVTMLTPRDQMAGLVHFTVAGIAPDALCQRLTEQSIIARHTPNPLAVRVSTGFYNSHDDIARLVAAIREAQAAS